MDNLIDIWFGLTGVVGGRDGSVWRLAIDFFLVGVIVFAFLTGINSAKGLRLFLKFAFTSGLLVAASYFELSGLRITAQGLLILLLVTLPIIFHQEWTEGLSGEKPKIIPAFSWPIKTLFSLVLAGLIVFIGHGVSHKTIEFQEELPIVATNLVEGLAANISNETTVSIVVTAPRERLASLNVEHFSATVDTANQREGTYDLEVKVSSLIPDVKVRKITPNRIVVVVEPIIKKTVPVTARFVGSAANNLVPDVPVFSPDRVEVTGPRSVINLLTQATAKVQIEGQTERFEQKVELQALDSAGNVITTVSFDPPQVNGIFPLITAGKLRTVGIRPVLTGQPAVEFWVGEVVVTPSAVSVTGSAEQLSKLTAIPTEPIRIDGLAAPQTINVNLALPAGITLSDSSVRVSVNINLRESQSQRTVVPVFEFQNIGGGLRVEGVSPANLTALISGPIALLNQADGRVTVTIDLGAYRSAGTFSVIIDRASIKAPEGISVVSFLPTAIDVTLATR